MDKDRSKILVSLWEPLINSFNKKVRAACLRRDEFLDRVLKHEATMLEKEVGKRNSDAAKDYITKHLAMLRRKPVNLKLGAETVEAINLACAQVNVPRDAFINRVILFLVVDHSFIRPLLGIDWDWAEGRVTEDYFQYFEPGMDGALRAVSSTVDSDPFRFYRACIEVARADGDASAMGLHEGFIPREYRPGKHAPVSWIGFNCYVPDSQVEGHPEYMDVDKLLAELDELFGGASHDSSEEHKEAKP